MKIKTSELTGAALDWAVSVAEQNVGWELEGEDRDHYSSRWDHGGPIIEREDINVARHTRSEITESQQEAYRKDGWTAFTTVTAYWMTPIRQFGPTPLIAAMRCYVASNLGDVVDVPEELQEW